MTHVEAFFLGTGISFAIATTVVLVVRKRLTTILTELCGTAERAAFWVLLANLTVILSATLLGMAAGDLRERDGRTPFEGIVVQVEFALGGMIASLVVLAMVIGKSITRFEERADAAGKHAAGSSVPSLGGARP